MAVCVCSSSRNSKILTVEYRFICILKFLANYQVVSVKGSDNGIKFPGGVMSASEVGRNMYMWGFYFFRKFEDDEEMH